MIIYGLCQLFLKINVFHTFLPDFSLVASRQHIEVRLERAHADHVVVLAFLQRFAEYYVVLQRRVLDPSLLRHVRHTAWQMRTTKIYNKLLLVLLVSCSVAKKNAASSILWITLQSFIGPSLFRKISPSLENLLLHSR